jgi:predicted nucleic acid-binding protein
MRQVIDASSLLTLIKKVGAQARDILKNSITVSLVYYEVGNALRTSAVNLKHITPMEAESVLRNLHEILQLVAITPQDNIEDSVRILQNSITYRLSYYDSAYLTAAVKHSAALVTEDNKLAEAAREANLDTVRINELIKTYNQ